MGDALSVLSDAPVGLDGDGLSSSRYVEPLVEVITSENTETPFTIGVFGPWGSGKTSLLRMLEQTLVSDHAGRTVRVHFNPWMHRGEANMLLPLLHAVHDTLEGEGGGRFREVARKIGVVITRLTSDILLRKVTAGAVTLQNIEEQSRQYASRHGEVESTIRTLHDTLQEQADKVASAGARLVLFIDDLDRCEPHEIIDLLESVKLFLDLRNVVVIFAIAKNVIDRGVAVKYQGFGFDKDKVVRMADEYLDKLIQLPLYLLPIESSAYLSGLALPDELAEHRELISRIVVPNPRRIKRVMNLALVAHAIARRTEELGELRLDVMLRLVTLRVQSPELYEAITVRPELAAALEASYAGMATEEQLIDRYGAAVARPLGKDLERFSGSDEYLRALFGDAVFTEVAGDLYRYLTMLGG